MRKLGSLDKTVLYTAGALFLDVVAGSALTGRPLSESLGLDHTEYLERNKEIALGSTMMFSLIRNHYRIREENASERD